MSREEGARRARSLTDFSSDLHMVLTDILRSKERERERGVAQMLSSHNKKGSPKSGEPEQEVQKGAVIEPKEETKLVEC